MQPDRSMKGSDEVGQKPSSSAMASFGPGKDDLDLDLRRA